MGSFHINPDSALGKELVKWEQHRTKYVGDDQEPGNPFNANRPYPKMLYRAVTHPKTGKALCMDMPPNPMLFTSPQEYDRACQATERLNQTCTRVVGSDSEERNAKNEGWTNSPVTAIEQFNALLVNVADEAARRNFRDQSMSAKARAEVAVLEDATHEQIGDIPAPRKKRGRKPNAPMVTVPAMPESEQPE